MAIYRGSAQYLILLKICNALMFSMVIDYVFFWNHGTPCIRDRQITLLLASITLRDTTQFYAEVLASSFSI
jgi:hypothetical protein